MIHQICEAYPGLSPVHLEEHSPDQIYLLWCSAEKLKTGSTIKKMGMAEAVSSGIVSPKSDGKSLFQRIKEQKALERAGLDVTKGTKRDRRRRRREQLLLTVAASQTAEV